MQDLCRSFSSAAAAFALIVVAGADPPPLPPCSSYTPYAYVGCFYEGSPMALQYNPNLYYYSMTVETCTATCKSNGFRYAGLEYYGDCFCGTMLAAPAPETDCNAPCTGNSSEICGQDQRISVWQDPTYSSVDLGTIVADYLPLGCYTEGTNFRALSYRQTQLSASSLTTEECLAACGNEYYPLAGTEFSGECYCGAMFQGGSQPAPATDCNMPCSGNVSEICGGPNRLNVYEANILESNEPCTVFNTIAPTASTSTTLSSAPTSSTSTSTSSTSTSSSSTFTSTSTSSATSSFSSTSTTLSSSTTSSTSTSSSSASSTSTSSTSVSSTSTSSASTFSTSASSTSTSIASTSSTSTALSTSASATFTSTTSTSSSTSISTSTSTSTSTSVTSTSATFTSSTSTSSISSTSTFTSPSTPCASMSTTASTPRFSTTPYASRSSTSTFSTSPAPPITIFVSTVVICPSTTHTVSATTSTPTCASGPAHGYAPGESTPLTLSDSDKPWGWVITGKVPINGTLYIDVDYNDPSKGTKVGTFTIAEESSNLVVTLTTNPPFYLRSTYFYSTKYQIDVDLLRSSNTHNNLLQGATSDQFIVPFNSAETTFVVYAEIGPTCKHPSSGESVKEWFPKTGSNNWGSENWGSNNRRSRKRSG